MRSFSIVINGGIWGMGTKPLIHIEEHDREWVVEFRHEAGAPEEESALYLLKGWVLRNISDYAARRYIGCAPRGHHPEGGEHHKNEDAQPTAYLFQMLLYSYEVHDSTYCGAEVREAPQGLFLVGDVPLNEFRGDGGLDIGTSLENAYGVMTECLAEMGGYTFDLQERPHYEEHIWHREWFTGELGADKSPAGFKLWLPIKKV